MPSLREVADKVNFLLTNGDDNAERKCHFGLIDVEAKERAANPKQHKRLIKEMTPEEYGEWNAEFDRFYEAAGNPVIARSIMLRAWRQLSNELIRTLADDTGDEDFMMGRGETVGDA